MADLSIKNVPPELHRRLRQSARENQRSLNREAIYRMQLGLSTVPHRTPSDVKKILDRARRIRRRMKGSMTVEAIIAAKNEGRP